MSQYFRALTPRFSLTALACALPLLAQAQAANPVAVFQGGFTGLQLQVADLTPEDGLTAGYTIEGVGMLDFVEGTEQWQNSLLPAAPITYTASTGSHVVTATTDSLTSRIEVSLDDLLAQPSPFPAPEGLAFFRSSIMQYSILSAPLFASEAVLTLAPHTSVRITGSAFFDLSLDDSAVNSWATSQGYDFYELDLQAPDGWQNVLTLDMDQFRDNPSVTFELNSMEVEGGRQGMVLTQDAPGWIEFGSSDTFDIVLTNQSDTALIAPMGMYVGMGGELNLMAGKTPTAIPEPGTWALMGLGLVGLALAGRRSACR